MSIRLRPLTGESLPEALKLRLRPGQERFVAPVAESIAEAHFEGGGTLLYSIHLRVEPANHPGADDQGWLMVGFVSLFCCDRARYPAAWWVWKFLLDARWQGRGHGRTAIRQIARMVEGWGGDRLLLAYLPGPEGPEGFYRHLGFQPLGEPSEEGEVEAQLLLRP